MADFTLVAKIAADATKFAEGFHKAQDSLDDFAKKMDGFGKKMESVGSGFTKAGAVMTAGITAPLALGVKGAMDFEDGMANINTLLSDTKNFEKYGDAVLAASNRTGIGMDVMQEGMYQTISSLGDLGDETTGMFDMMATSAKAGGAQVSDSVALISSGMKGYNDISTETAQKISDLAFETAKLGVTTFPEMASSMQPLFPLASSLNVSYEELFGTMATLTGVTGNTAEVTTQMKSIFSGLMSPTEQMTQMMGKYGYANAQAMIESEGLAGFLSIVKDETGGQADKMASLFGSVEAVTAATALCGVQYDTFGDKLTQMQNVTGATQTAYDKLETNGNSLRETLNTLKNTFVEISKTVLELIGPALQGLGEKVQQFGAFVAGLTDEQKQMLGTFLLIAAAIGPVLVVFGALFGSVAKIADGIKNIVTVGSMLSSGIAKLFTLIAANPIAAIIVAIGAVIAIIVYLWNNCEWFRDGVIAAWEAIKSFFAGLPAFFSGIWNAISSWATTTWESICNTASAAWQAICDFFAGAVDFFAQAWDSIVLFATTAWQGICDAFSAVGTFFSEVWTAITNAAAIAWQNICLFFAPAITFFTALWNMVLSVVELVWGIIVTVINICVTAVIAVFQLLGVAICAVWDAICAAAIIVWNAVSQAATVAWETISTAFMQAVDFFVGLWDAVFEVVQVIWAAIVTAIQNAITELVRIFQIIQDTLCMIWNTVCNVAATIWDAICNTVSGAIEWIVSVATPIIDVFDTIFSSIWNTVESVFTSVGNLIADVFTGIENAWNGLKGFVSGVFDGIFSAVQSLVDAVKGFVNGVIGGINGAIGLINMIPGVSIGAIPYLLHGTEDWSGGFARMNEGGRGELVYLPGGAQVIPHDISVQYAKEAARASASPQLDQTGTGGIGREIASAMRQVLAEQWGGGVLNISVNLDGREVYRNQQSVAQSMGYNVGGMQYAR